MNSKVRALIWEECRTGGLIAAAGTALGALLLLEGWFTNGVGLWDRDTMLAGFAVYGIPMLTALLLVLNPDYAGHLVGGFSRRVLRLPVTTAEAVGAALVPRTVFVFLASSGLVGLSRALFDREIGFEVAYAVTSFYLFAQAIDWMRGPVSGLSSLVVVAIVVMLIERALPGESRFALSKWATDVRSWPPTLLPIGVAAGAMLVYAISLATVRAQRIGRRYGVPEIWEWPGRVSISSGRQRAPFRSAMAAQVWFELRRSARILPIGAVALAALWIGGVWIYRAAESKPFDLDRRLTASFLLFAWLLLAALAQGAYSRVVGFRRTTGKAGYELLQPLTSAQFAQARVLANLWLLVPTVAGLLVLHFALGGPKLIAEWIPEGLRSGMISPRETAWILLSRGVAAGILAWALMAVGTRVFRRAIGVLFGLSFAVAAIGDKRLAMETIIFTVLIPSALTVVLYVYARRQELISGRSLAAWFAAWMLTAWMLLRATLPAMTEGGLPLSHQFLAVANAIGIASLVPLPFVAMLLDLRRKRHGAACAQDPAQHAPVRVRPAGAIAAGVAAAAVLWLGWPAKPAYLDYRKTKGYPTTIAELKATYPEVPKAENVALEYGNVFDELAQHAKSFRGAIAQSAGKMEALDAENRWLIVGGAPDPGKGPIDPKTWTETEKYWNAVTARLTPKLLALATRDTSRAHYPVEMDQLWEYSSALGRVGLLQRELHLDALHWAVAKDPARAAQSVLAGFVLAKSAENVPLASGQSERMELLADVALAIQTMMNRSEPDGPTLAQLQQACEDAVPDPAAVDRALIGASLLFLRHASFFPYENYENPEMMWETVNAPAAVWRMISPSAGSFLLLSRDLEAQLAERHLPWNGPRNRWDDRSYLETYREATFVAPGAAGFLGSDSDWGVSGSARRARIQLEATRAALAVERFRIARGALPKTLMELTPEFLTALGEDYYAGPGQPLSYRLREDGSYAVYSVGRDQIDDVDRDPNALERGRRRNIDDIGCSVGPLSVRSGPQVAGE